MNDQRRRINEDELNIFYNLIGQGIWYLQHVENALITYLLIKSDIKEIGSVEKVEADNILEKYRGNTLGTSLRLAEEKNLLHKDLMLVLREFKQERDWLVHRSMNQNGDDLYLHSTRQAVINRLERFSNQARGLQKLIAKELEDYVVDKGVSRQWIYKRANQDINKKCGRNT